jgi:hypothetical protein
MRSDQELAIGVSSFALLRHTYGTLVPIVLLYITERQSRVTIKTVKLELIDEGRGPLLKSGFPHLVASFGI